MTEEQHMALPTARANAVWLIWASEGEYSDRNEWPVVATTSQETAEWLTKHLTELWRSADTIWRDAELNCWDDGVVKEFWETQPECIEYQRLTGATGRLGDSYSDERSFYCCEITVLPAQAIEARRAETERLGAKHESAVHAPEKE